MNGVVLHVPEGERVGRGIANARNLLEDLPGVEVVLVLNGDAVASVAQTSGQSSALSSLVGRGVGIRACARSLRRYGVDPASLVAGVAVVPGGVVEAARLQGEGYAYLRP